MSPMSPLLQEKLESFRARHIAWFEHELNRTAAAPQLQEAMAYSALLGGKRIRPFLVYATGEMLDVPLAALDAPAAALECIHAYSLAHDDLPAMDNDALRRGQPTCHVKFGEATAILAGDALQALAFELIGREHPQLAPEQQIAMIRKLAEASGASGMCGGQALDIAATGKATLQSELETIHHLKTGALIRAALAIGALAAPNVSPAILAALDEYGQAIGLAFQVKDDILDQTSDPETLGKATAADIALNKTTYATLLGIDGAEQLLKQLTEKALHALQQIPYNTELLQDFTEYLVTRDH
ncbi:(2E,6E)-farnesyl diphosphate synthase [Aliidiomarina haloalkalitolerans]|nr:(2E,6E)-farnesyl diphosphate synthase [Aliidiomarina haloalkalitolerans]MCL4409427.1 (2E,6E)-farnesyl diphosphate synthase [Gammaproteobacteria bacterium]